MRRLGYLLLAAGLLTATYVTVLLRSGDPITGLYAHYEQRQLRHELAERQPAPGPGLPSAAARGPRPRRPTDGSPLGVIRIPRIGLAAVFVQGTTTAALDRAPGHYANTLLPGSRGVVAIAAHRTTYGAWFRQIDVLRKGDPIYLDYEHHRYTYTVTGHRIVLPNDWSIIRYRGYPKLVLSSCHPLYSASHRYVVFARLSASRRLRA